MTWTQVSPTRWERPLEGMESYALFTGDLSKDANDDRLQYTLFTRARVSLNIPNPEPALQQAWKQVRYEEPDIATTLENDKKVYEVADAAALEKWVDETFIIDTSHTSEEIYQQGRKTTESRLYYLPTTSELILSAHHATIDGIGTVKWWDKFFRALTNPNPNITFGDEHKRLAPPLSALLGGSGANPLTSKQQDQGTNLFLEYVTKLPAIGFVSAVGKSPPGNAQGLEHVFDEATTRAIIAATKQRGIRVTAAVHAAYILTIANNAAPDSNTARYTSPAQFNLRNHLAPPYNETAASNYFLPQPFSLDLPATFDQVTQTLTKYYRTYIAENPYIFDVHGHFISVLNDTVRSAEYQNAPIPTDALVSSLGVIENHLQREYGDGAVVVEDWKFSLDVVIGISGLHFYTFRDRLRVVAEFNDGYEDVQKVKGYLKEMEGILRRELVGDI
ncbi:hypothetical protein BJX70DRAFT_357463 [Aspergillus crustosus]